MIEVKIEKENIILSFPKDLIFFEDVQRFVELLEMEKMAQKSNLSEEEGWKLSEEMKEEWWKENKEYILKKIKNESSC